MSSIPNILIAHAAQAGGWVDGSVSKERGFVWGLLQVCKASCNENGWFVWGEREKACDVVALRGVSVRCKRRRPKSQDRGDTLPLAVVEGPRPRQQRRPGCPGARRCERIGNNERRGIVGIACRTAAAVSGISVGAQVMVHRELAKTDGPDRTRDRRGSLIAIVGVRREDQGVACLVSATRGLATSFRRRAVCVRGGRIGSDRLLRLLASNASVEPCGSGRQRRRLIATECFHRSVLGTNAPHGGM